MIVATPLQMSQTISLSWSHICHCLRIPDNSNIKCHKPKWRTLSLFITILGNPQTPEAPASFSQWLPSPQTTKPNKQTPAPPMEDPIVKLLSVWNPESPTSWMLLAISTHPRVKTGLLSSLWCAYPLPTAERTSYAFFDLTAFKSFFFSLEFSNFIIMSYLSGV